MATKNFYATGSFRYNNRMLKAGDGPVAMDGPTARLYGALGKITATKPAGPANALGNSVSHDGPQKPLEPAKPKAPRKRKAAAKKAPARK